MTNRQTDQILLVDDDDQLRLMLKIVLERAGYVVQEAASGREAIRLFEATPMEIVITDLIMPEVEGIEVIKALRVIDPSVKVIAMSGGGRISSQCYLAIARGMGAHRTLEKPFSHQDLLKAIAEVSESKQISST